VALWTGRYNIKWIKVITFCIDDKVNRTKPWKKLTPLLHKYVSAIWGSMNWFQDILTFVYSKFLCGTVLNLLIIKGKQCRYPLLPQATWASELLQSVEHLVDYFREAPLIRRKGTLWLDVFASKLVRYMLLQNSKFA